VTSNLAEPFFSSMCLMRRRARVEEHDRAQHDASSERCSSCQAVAVLVATGFSTKTCLPAFSTASNFVMVLTGLRSAPHRSSHREHVVDVLRRAQVRRGGRAFGASSLRSHTIVTSAYRCRMPRAGVRPQ